MPLILFILKDAQSDQTSLAWISRLSNNSSKNPALVGAKFISWG